MKLLKVIFLVEGDVGKTSIISKFTKINMNQIKYHQ